MHAKIAPSQLRTLLAVAAFSCFVMKEKLTMNYLYAALCMVGAVFFIFRGN